MNNPHTDRVSVPSSVSAQPLETGHPARFLWISYRLPEPLAPSSALQVHGDVTVRELSKSFLGDDRAGEVSQEALQRLAGMGRDGDARVDIEPRITAGGEWLPRADLGCGPWVGSWGRVIGRSFNRFRLD